MHALRLGLRMLGASVRSQMQYPASFVIQAIAHFAITGLEFIGLAGLLARFGGVRGWTLPEVALLYGMISVAFALADMIARGFDAFGSLVRLGDFDRLLLRPMSPALQVAASTLHLRSLGQLAQGAAVLAYATTHAGIEWSAARIALVVAAIVGGTCLFVGLFMAQATIAFWTVESLEVVNCVTHGGVETARLPLSIYPGGFRFVFTFIVPLAAVSFIPAQALLGRTTSALAWAAPAAGLAVACAGAMLFALGTRHYRSTGS